MKKILVYLEPHPIRNTMIAFEGVLMKFVSLMSKGNRECFKFYASSALIGQVKKADYFPEFREHLVYPTPKEDGYFNSHMVTWDTKGMIKWQELMNGGKIAQDYEKIICGIHERYPFEYIIHWGTNSAVKSAAAKLDVGYIDMELGCSRLPFKDSLVMDPWGVNGSSSISQAICRDFDDIEESDAYEDLLMQCEGSSGYEAMFHPTYQHELQQLIGKPKVAFIPLQLYDDANLLQYSPYEEVINVLEDILPKLQSAGYTCLIKEHPASFIRRGSAKANEKAYQYAKQFDNVIWMGEKYKDISNAFLFNVSELIVTVNSSTGFEALYYDKPVVVLGEAVYKPRGVFPTLDEYLSGKFSYDEYRHAVARVRNFFLKYYLLGNDVLSNWKKFIHMVQKVGDMSREKLTTGEIVHRFSC